MTSFWYTYNTSSTALPRISKKIEGKSNFSICRKLFWLSYRFYFFFISSSNISSKLRANRDWDWILYFCFNFLLPLSLFVSFQFWYWFSSFASKTNWNLLTDFLVKQMKASWHSTKHIRKILLIDLCLC